jgi:hypothetical protein
MSNKEPVLKNSQQIKNQFSIVHLFIPSIIGVAIYSLIFIAALIINQTKLYDSAFFSFSLNDFSGSIIYRSLSDISSFLKTSFINNIAVYAFWLIVAFIVYTIAARLTKNVSELASNLSLRQYIWPKGKDKNAPTREFLEKIGFHALMLIVIIFYLFKIAPISLDIWTKNTLKFGLNLHSIEVFVSFLIIDFLILHVLVILVRLFLTRTRIINY